MARTPDDVVKVLRLLKRRHITRVEFINFLVCALDETEDWAALLSVVPSDIRNEAEQKAKDPTHPRFYIGGGRR